MARQYGGMRSNQQRASKVAEGKLAWVRVNTISVSFFRSVSEFLDGLPKGSKQAEEYKPLTEGDGDQIVLTVETYNSLSTIPLSEMTVAELKTLQLFIDTAISEALPIAEARDRISEEVLNDYGDDSNARVYRAVPELSVRKGKGGEHNTSLWKRLEGTEAVLRFPGQRRQLADDSSEVADSDASDGGTQDNGA